MRTENHSKRNYAFGTELTGKTYNPTDYTFGYNGKLKDDEVFGASGTFYDYGKRNLDVRGLPIFLTVDPLTKKYSSFSPYNFVLNNPVILRDADGNVVVDANGNPVKVTVTQNEDGTYKATFDFVPNTNEDIQKDFMKNGGRAINSAIQVKTGREQVQKAQETEDKIMITITPAIKEEKTEGGTKRIFGDTQSGLPAKETEKGKNIDIFILEGSIEKEKKVGNEFDKISKEQAVGVTLGHEIEHATNKEGLTKAAEEKVATQKGTEIKKEFQKLNETKTKDK